MNEIDPHKCCGMSSETYVSSQIPREPRGQAAAAEHEVANVPSSAAESLECTDNRCIQFPPMAVPGTASGSRNMQNGSILF